MEIITTFSERSTSEGKSTTDQIVRSLITVKAQELYGANAYKMMLIEE